jgi:L-threonylcarbamoyladenylate synthase
MEIIKCNKRKGCENCDLPESELDRIAAEIKAGRLVVYPTETVYGLGANPFDENAVKRVYLAKNRPFDMPLSIAVADMDMLESVAVMDQTSRRLASRFMPGPLTLLLTKKPMVPDIVTASSDEVGIRIPDHRFALRLIAKCGPIISTSANLHSHPDPATLDKTVKDLGDAVSIYVDCGRTKLGKPSTIVEVREGKMEIIRQGAISTKQVEAALDG